MADLDRIIREAKKQFGNTVAVSDNTRNGEQVGVKGKTLTRIAVDYAKKRVHEMTTDGPDSDFPDQKKYPKEAQASMERKATDLMFMSIGLPMNSWGTKNPIFGVTTAKGSSTPGGPIQKLISGTVSPRGARTAFGSGRKAIGESMPISFKIRDPKKYVDIVKSLSPVRNELAVSDIVKGMSSRGEKFIGTHNAYPSIPSGSKFSPNIGTGGQNEGAGFYSASYGENTPLYYAALAERQRGSARLGENIILSDGRFSLGGTNKKYFNTEDGIDGMLYGMGFKRGPKRNVANKFDILSDRHISSAGTGDPNRFSEEGLKKNMGYGSAAGIRRWVKDISQGIEPENAGGPTKKAREVLVDAYYNSPMFSKFIDRLNGIGTGAPRKEMEFQRRNDGSIIVKNLVETRDVNGNNPRWKSSRDYPAPKTISDIINKAYDIGLDERSAHLKAGVELKDTADYLRKNLKKMEYSDVDPTNAVFVGAGGNTNYVTNPANTHPIASVDAYAGISKKGRAYEYADKYIPALESLKAGSGRYQGAYDIAKDAELATIRGASGYQHQLSEDIIKRIKRTDRYATGREAVMHALKKYLDAYGE